VNRRNILLVFSSGESTFPPPFTGASTSLRLRGPVRLDSVEVPSFFHDVLRQVRFLLSRLRSTVPFLFLVPRKRPLRLFASLFPRPRHPPSSSALAARRPRLLLFFSLKFFSPPYRTMGTLSLRPLFVLSARPWSRLRPSP